MWLNEAQMADTDIGFNRAEKKGMMINLSQWHDVYTNPFWDNFEWKISEGPRQFCFTTLGAFHINMTSDSSDNLKKIEKKKDLENYREVCCCLLIIGGHNIIHGSSGSRLRRGLRSHSTALTVLTPLMKLFMQIGVFRLKKKRAVKNVKRGEPRLWRGLSDIIVCDELFYVG